MRTLFFHRPGFFHQTGLFRQTSWALLLLAWFAPMALAQMEPPLKRPAPAPKTIDIQDQAPKIKVMNIAVHAWSPLAGADLQSMGPIPRLVSQALSTDGSIQIRYRFVHWSKALDMLAANEVDAAVIWVSGDLQLDPFLMSKPLQVQRAALYFRKPATYSDDIGTIAPARLAWQKDYVYEFDVFRKISDKTLKPIPVKDELTGLQAVADGQADVFIAPWAFARSALKQLDARQQQSLGYVLLKNDFPPAFFLLNASLPSSEAKMKQFNQGLRRLQMDGRYDKILGN